MFKWRHEYSMEINIPIKKVWEFYTNPSNWPKWVDQFETCNTCGGVKTGAIVSAKLINRKLPLPILITEINSSYELSLLVRVPLSIQENFTTMKEISPDRTRINMKMCISSWLIPFVRIILRKRTERQYSKLLEVLSDITKN